MLTAQTYKKLTVILLCMLLITPTPTKPMQPTFEASSSQSYIIACFASLCIGASVYAFIHKCCSGDQPTIILKQSPLEDEAIKEKLFNPLYTSADTTKNNLKEVMKLLTEQKKSIEELNTKLIDMQKHMDRIANKTKITKKNSTLLLEESQRLAEIDTYYTKNNIIIPLCLSLYLTNIRQKQKLIDKQQAQDQKHRILTLQQQHNTKNS